MDQHVASLPQLIALKNLRPGNNPRTYFDPVEMADLTDSVRANGIMQPILVRPLGDAVFQIIAGERRFRAALAVYGEEWEMPVLVRDCTDEEADRLGLVENVERAAMSPAEEAERANSILMHEGGDHAEAARKLGWSVTKLRRRVALMALLPEVRAALTHRTILLGHAELLAGAVPHDEQLRALASIIEKKLTVDQVRLFIASRANDLTKAVFEKTECAGCPHNSAQQAALFGESLKEGKCTKPVCYQGKTEAHLEGLRVGLLEEVPKVILLRQDSAIATIKLVADGSLGVGEEQAKACLSCENFGCTVSGVLGSVGEVEKDICFDAGCHMLKVAAHIKASKAVARAASAVKSGDAGLGREGKEAAPAKKRAVSVSVPQKVKDYRLGQWRKMAAQVAFGSPANAFALLIGLGLSGNTRHIDASKLREILMALTKESQLDFHGSLKGAAEAVQKLTPEVAQRMAHAMACSAMKQIDEHQLLGAMEFLGVDVGKLWKLDAEFLGLMTKSEVMGVAEEVGIAAALGEKEFKKASVGKKDEFIKVILSVEGFEYQGAVPQVMDYQHAKNGGVMAATSAVSVEEAGAEEEAACGASTNTEEAGSQAAPEAATEAV